MTAGCWMVRCCRFCPEVAARTWLCDYEPGLPENKLDQPYWQGQIGLDLVPPGEIWEMVEFIEASPEERARLARPLPLRTDVRAGRAAKLDVAPMALWKRQRARRITAAQFEAQINWLRWAERNAPARPEFNFRQPAVPSAVEIPRFL